MADSTQAPPPTPPTQDPSRTDSAAGLNSELPKNWWALVGVLSTVAVSSLGVFVLCILAAFLVEALAPDTRAWWFTDGSNMGSVLGAAIGGVAAAVPGVAGAYYAARVAVYESHFLQNATEADRDRQQALSRVADTCEVARREVQDRQFDLVRRGRRDNSRVMSAGRLPDWQYFYETGGWVRRALAPVGNDLPSDVHSALLQVTEAAGLARDVVLQRTHTIEDEYAKQPRPHPASLLAGRYPGVNMDLVLTLNDAPVSGDLHTDSKRLWDILLDEPPYIEADETPMRAGTMAVGDLHLLLGAISGQLRLLAADRNANVSELAKMSRELIEKYSVL